jgi:hypothetical protein
MAKMNLVNFRQVLDRNVKHKIVDNNENHNLCEITYFQKWPWAFVDSF